MFVRPDYNSNGHQQWFYFSVTNLEPNRTYKFIIVTKLLAFPWVSTSGS